MKVVFLGEGIIAANAIRKIKSKHDIVGIGTTENIIADRRNQKMNPVLELCHEMGIVPLSFNKSNDILSQEIKKVDPDIIVVASFGMFLSSKITSIGNYPAINIHPSRLPQFRGAAPIARAIEMGLDKTSICIIEITKKMDAGDIFLMQDIDILPHYNSSDLYHIVGNIGGELVLQVIEDLKNGSEVRTIQDSSLVTFANKVSKEELLINFHENCAVICNKIRAFDVFGGCYFILDGKRVKIWQAKYEIIPHGGPIGELNREKLCIFANDGIILPQILQRENKAKVNAKEFWNGILA